MGGKLDSLSRDVDRFSSNSKLKSEMAKIHLDHKFNMLKYDPAFERIKTDLHEGFSGMRYS